MKRGKEFQEIINKIDDKNKEINNFYSLMNNLTPQLRQARALKLYYELAILLIKAHYIYFSTN